MCTIEEALFLISNLWVIYYKRLHSEKFPDIVNISTASLLNTYAQALRCRDLT